MELPGGGNISNIGIDGIEFYFPRNYVSQTDLEHYNNISSGKYTIGLGQQEMGFCADNEDIVSISLTVTKKLMDTYKVLPNSIGCLVVGTETLIDKSKSVKTALMDLFDDCSDIEGVDIKNACFGGAQALLHAVDWVHVNHQVENRDAIVVVADIAIYEDGPARCTGGAGAIAFLIRPNATIPIDRVLATCFMRNSWDFYKPITSKITEYPTVDGSLSLASYLGAVKTAYGNFKKKASRVLGTVTLEEFDAVFFHSPFTKIVQKGLAVMHYSDLSSDKLQNGDKALDENDRAAMAKMIEMSSEVWKKKTDPYLTFNRRIGNMYTPSLFAQLLAYLASDNCVQEPNEKHLLFFAYGSGLASAVFPARLRQTERLEKIRQSAKSAIRRLDARKQFTPEEFTKVLNMRERFLVAQVPESLPKLDNELTPFPGTFYLEKIDEFHRRSYKIYEEPNIVANGNGIVH
ncbi:unnamed protein product [Caenorhabditis bovis]|uniref:Hydroxymethylglutaryl-CoA synthase n=1 Tax=Caenorhabditis bovis TaxID=2654633 RepID=A0A8S1E3Q5_9PELO|nr:unnamed protein product [Caenorhabditis bovis]